VYSARPDARRLSARSRSPEPILSHESTKDTKRMGAELHCSVSSYFVAINLGIRDGLRTCGKAGVGYNAVSLKNKATELLVKETGLAGACDGRPAARQLLLRRTAGCFTRTMR